MWDVVAIISGISGLAVILHSLLRHYLTSSKSHMQKPQSKDEKRNRDYSEPQPRDSFRERKVHRHFLTSGKYQENKPQSQDKNQNKSFDEINSILKLLQESPWPELYGEVHELGHMSNSNASDALIRRRPLLSLKYVMEALTDPDTHLIGFYGSHAETKDSFLEKVCRRIHRDNLFDVVLTATVTRKHDVKNIQEEIARQLGHTFTHKSKNERAQELITRIKIGQKIVAILRDLYKEFDLRKVGVPYGVDHVGCKIILTSTTEDVLSNHMHTQKNFIF